MALEACVLRYMDKAEAKARVCQLLELFNASVNEVSFKIFFIMIDKIMPAYESCARSIKNLS